MTFSWKRPSLLTSCPKAQGRPYVVWPILNETAVDRTTVKKETEEDSTREAQASPLCTGPVRLFYLKCLCSGGFGIRQCLQGRRLLNSDTQGAQWFLHSRGAQRDRRATANTVNRPCLDLPGGCWLSSPGPARLLLGPGQAATCDRNRRSCGGPGRCPAVSEDALQTLMTRGGTQCVWVTAERAVTSLTFQAGSQKAAASPAICLGHFTNINSLLKKLWKQNIYSKHITWVHLIITPCNCGMEK